MCPVSMFPIGNKDGRNKEGRETMNNTNEITFTAELVEKLRLATTTASVAVGEAALQAVAQNRKVTVRVFANTLRTYAPMLGTSNTVFTAAIKAAKEKNTTLEAVCQAMADAADKKRRDDARRAAKKRDAAPGKALEKAQKKVEECLKALRTPLQVAIDEVAETEKRVKEISAVLRAARAARRAARAKLEAMTKPTEQNAA